MWFASEVRHHGLFVLGCGALLASLNACGDEGNGDDSGRVVTSTPTETSSANGASTGDPPAPQGSPPGGDTSTPGSSTPTAPSVPDVDASPQNGGASASGGSADGGMGGGGANTSAGGASVGGAPAEMPTGGAPASNGGVDGSAAGGNGGTLNGGSPATGGSAANGGAPPDDGRGPHAPTSGTIEVLYDGNGFAAWTPLEPGLSQVNWMENAAEGWMEVTPTYTNHIVTNEDNLHRDIFLHLEFRSPDEDPAQMGQDRGNSGIYLQSRYEVQILDSYGNAPGLDTCGAIYEVSVPLVNACNPAEEWNTYEISFTAPAFEGGQKVANARITAWLNDQLVQDDVEVPGPTRSGAEGEPDEPLPLYLQDHGDTVRFRNIWWIRL